MGLVKLNGNAMESRVGKCVRVTSALIWTILQEKESVMGLIDFIRDAGERIFGQGQVSPGGEAKQEADASAALAKTLSALGLPLDDLSIQVKGDVATVSGKAKSQADREKAVLVVGNTMGIAQVDDQITVEQPEPEATYYTVQRGDTLSKIAREHYGNASKYPVIFEANQPMLKDPDKIYPGQKLRIPPPEAQA
jgi:nucleoid-associated protein YgaU